MAQLRAEVRPLVSNMPTEGFAMQTGGSARRRVVPFDTSTNSYKVTGVPGHTHNASAVCSVLVDNTEKSNVPLIISDHFAYQAVNVPGDRFTDSHEFDEPEYDRALERGIGEIAIIPENCHQEIREPARAIGELRTLVMPKDKRDTLTYVEEVGGFVDVSTGEVPDPEPLYPDVVVDLFHSYALPVAAAVAVQVGDLRTGTGNTPFADGELRFVGYDPTNGTWSREAGAGHGSSFVPLRQVGGNLATVDGQPWEGVITMRWDPNDKHYICSGFEAVFTQMYETTQHPDAGTVVTQTHNNFEIVFPTITTTVSEDGQCLFTGSERPLRDAPAANEGYEQIRCEIDQSNLHKAIAGSFLYLRVYPFRIATGFSSAINGPAIGTNFWQFETLKLQALWKPFKVEVQQTQPHATACTKTTALLLRQKNRTECSRLVLVPFTQTAITRSRQTPTYQPFFPETRLQEPVTPCYRLHSALQDRVLDLCLELRPTQTRTILI